MRRAQCPAKAGGTLKRTASAPWLVAPSLLLLLLLLLVAARAFLSRGGRAVYYSPSTREAPALWARDHAALLPGAPGVLRALGAVRFERVDASAAGRRRLCIGVTLYRTRRAEVWSLLASLAARRLAVAIAHGRRSAAVADNVAPVEVPIALAVYWQPSDAADAQEGGSAAVRKLRELGVDVVRVDEGVAVLRARQLASCNDTLGAAATATLRAECPSAAEGTGVPPTPPHAYGFALEDLSARAGPGGCAGGLLMLEDDVVAELDWEARVRGALVDASLRDPEWRFVKLHEPDTFNKWDAPSAQFAFGSIATVFGVAMLAAHAVASRFAATSAAAGAGAAAAPTLSPFTRRAAAALGFCTCALAAAWAESEWRVGTLYEASSHNAASALLAVGGAAIFGASVAIALASAAVPGQPLAKQAVAPGPPFTAAKAAFMTATAFCFSATACAALWVAGRPSAPCVLNDKACVGMAALRRDMGMSPSQAQLFNPRSAFAFSACMARTPMPNVTTGHTCYQIDLAQHACLAPQTATGYAALADGDAAACAALPRAPKPGAVECAIRDTGLTGLWGVQPSVFQHSGLLSGSGGVGLRVAENWDASGATLRAFAALADWR